MAVLLGVLFLHGNNVIGVAGYCPISMNTIKCTWQDFCRGKIDALKLDIVWLKDRMAWYPVGTFGYERVTLTISIWELKIGYWEALGGLD